MSAVLMVAAVFVVSVLGCWFGAPPDTRRQIITGLARDLRREREIRRWQHQQKKAGRFLLSESGQHQKKDASR